MAKEKGFFLKLGFCLILLGLTLSLTVWGAEQQPPSGFDAKLVTNFEIFDADIRDAFRGLAEYGGFNLLMDKKVQGNITTKFQAGINVREAIDVIAKTNGYVCYWMSEQQTVVIGDANTYKNLDTMYTRVYHLKYADPEAVAETLKVIVPKDRLGIDKRTNQLVVKGNLLEQENVRESVVGLDREMPQISIEMRIEETTRTALDELGVGWGENDFSMGMDGLKFTKVFSPAKVALNFWEEKTNSKLLAKPMVATTDSKEATIFIGDKIPIPKTTTDAAGNSSTDVTYTDVGTKLVVTPRINADDIVTVTVKATLSNVKEYVQLTAGYKVPFVRNREAGSVIRLRDGETFMLSGLNQEESSLTKKGLKGFQKIPLIGNLFKTTSKEDPKNGTEIVIFITPRIIHTEPQTAPVKEQPKKAENVTPASEAADAASTATASKPEVKSAVVADPPAIAPVSPPMARTSTVSDETALATVPQPAVNQAPAVTENKPVAKEQPLPLSKLGGIRLAVVVKPNQSMAQIAALYGVSAAKIITENGLTGKTALHPGQELFVSIPAEHIYYLASKETMWRISKRYGVPLDVLQEINQLEDVTKVESGQAIILPVATTAVVARNF